MAELVFNIKDLVYRYPRQDKDTIHSISLQVEKGTIFGLLGPSGAGKSTTQKIMTKLIRDYQGKIEFLGEDLRDFGKSFYETIGVGFEMPVHFNKLTAVENLKYFAALYKTTIDYEALLRRVGLYEAKDQPVGEYSKGMKIRLNFVRALLNNPDVLFLDEPTNGLDPTNAKIIKDLILEFKAKGKTVIITTHLMGDVEQLCDQVVFMVNGKLSEVASPRQWKSRYGRKIISVEYYENEQLKKREFPLEGLYQNQEFLDILKADIATIHSGETSLEDIFIQVTGSGFHG